MIKKKELEQIKKKVKKHHFDIVSATGRVSCDYLLKCFFKELDKLFALEKEGEHGN